MAGAFDLLLVSALSAVQRSSDPKEIRQLQEVISIGGQERHVVLGGVGQLR